MLKYLRNPQYLAPVDSTKGEEDFSVLTDRATIKNIVEDLCNKLHHPVTLIDFNRLSFANISYNEYRIDSEIEFYSLRHACRLLRKCAGADKCMECDRFHAKCMGPDVQTVKDNINDAATQTPDFFYEEYANNLPKVLDGFGRPVIEYHCPMLGYRELVFPINYSKNILGILFVGQIIVESEGDENTVKKTMESFFKKPINDPNRLFQNYVNAYRKEKDGNFTGQMIANLIKESDDKLTPFNEILNFDNDTSKTYTYYCKNFRTKSEYSTFIGIICESIEAIEKQFIDLFYAKQKKYFHKEVNEIVNDFFSSYSNRCTEETGADKRKAELELAWNNLTIVAEKLKGIFGFHDVTIFGDGNAVNVIESDPKKVFPPQVGEKSEWYYDFSSMNQYLSTAYDYKTSFDCHEILQGLHINISKSNCFLILYHDIAFLVEIKAANQDKELYKIISEVIGDSVSKINSTIALCSANYMKERHVFTLRMNRHESSHISARLNDNMKRYFANYGKNFINLDPEKQKLVVDDMHNTIHLISHMANNIGVITGSINEANIFQRIRNLDVYDLLYKWQVMFRNELKARNLDILILRNSSNNIQERILEEPYRLYKEGPRHIQINSELFELLIYNLVDNAVKYAHRGSKIYLSWHRAGNGLREVELTVTSYGPHMESGDALYRLYARGLTAELHVATGDGIGLYVVKRIAQLLKIQISHSSNFISKYNLPIISWYAREEFNSDDTLPVRQEDCSLMLQKLPGDLIINDNEYTSITSRDVTSEYLIKRIIRETWVTTFRVKLSF